MSRNKPDLATLDALVLGTDEPEDMSAWEWLVATPGSTQAWAGAVAQRDELERFAETLEAHPWIAVAMDRMRKLGSMVTRARLEVALAPELLGTSLGPEEEAGLEVAPSWGRIEFVSIRPGTHVELRVQGDTAGTARFFYRQASGVEGELPERRWRLEPGEAPVLLVACTEATAASTLDEALARGSSMAGVVLLEQPPE